MVRVLLGDLFNSKAHTLVNTVNTVGIMGKGVALEFKKHFPEMYEDYVRRCRTKQVRIGEPYLYRRLTPPWILNFPTKEHWRSLAKLSDIVRGLEYLEKHYQEWGIESLAVPPLGCGQGGLEWRVVGPTLYQHLTRLAIPIELYAPFGTPHEELRPEFLEHGEPSKTPPSRITAGEVALIEILSRIEKEPYHWPTGRTIFQKLAYFATYFGIPTGLEYRLGSYGPYAESVKRLSTRLLNNGLIREQRVGKNMFTLRVGPTYEAARKVYQADLAKWNPIIDRLSDLFLRMSTREAELAATVHFAYHSLTKREDRVPTEREVLSEVMRWKERRRPPLKEADVAETIRMLNVLGWLQMSTSEDLPVSEESVVGS